MSETFLYLTTIGHKSGNPHDIEIWYVDHQDCYYLCSGGREKTHWVQNILANPNVMFSVGIRDNQEAVIPRQAARAQVITAESDNNLFHIVSQLFNGKYNWSDGTLVEIRPNQTDGD
jgi:deazaflavin-dependent oxidoreductase (nitroreductase family)